jgi:hypothetical protein
MIAAVSASAGSSDSIRNSASVMSTALPNTVVVLKNDKVPSIVARRSGTATPSLLSPSGPSDRVDGSG